MSGRFQVNPGPLKVVARKQPASEHEITQAVRCRAATSLGARCTRTATNDSPYCWQHKSSPRPPGEQVTPNGKSLGKRIREARERRGLSQAELAKLIDRSRPAISLMEAGRQDFPVSQLSKLCSALGMDANAFLGINPHDAYVAGYGDGLRVGYAAALKDAIDDCQERLRPQEKR